MSAEWGRHPPDPEPRRIVLVGAGEMASIAHEYFTGDSPHEVVAFSVGSDYLEGDSYEGLPLVALETLTETHPPSEYAAFVAISWNKLNRIRRRLYEDVKARGYDLMTYVSSRAFVGVGATFGENTFVFENNNLQRGVSVGDDVILWSANHCGHHSVVEDHVFFSSHVVIAEAARIGASSFMAANTYVYVGVSVGTDCVVGAGAVVLSDTESGGVYVGVPARASGRSSLAAFGAAD